VTGRPRDGIALERAVLFTVGFGGMLIPLNSTMIAVGIPNISRQLHASVSQSGWLVTAYLITMAAFQPIAGKLGDRYGRRPFLIGGYLMFGLASLGAALSPNITTLILFRGGQALSGAVIFPNGTALLRTIVPEERRGARFGLLGSSIAFGAAVGPPLGGVLIEFGGWPAIFWVNLPIVAVVLIVAWRTIPAGSYAHSGERFDLPGAAILATVLAVGAWLLTRLGSVTSGVMVATVAVVVVGSVVFGWRELSYPDPVVQLRFFKRRAFAAATAAIALSNLALYVLILIVPLMLDRRPGWSEARIGLVVTSMSAGMVLFAPIGGRLSDRLGRRVPAFIGMSFLAVGVTSLAVLGQDVPLRGLLVSLALCGVGFGMGAGSLQTSAVETIEPEHAGMAAAASSTSRYVGSIVGAAVLAGLVSSPNGFQTVFTMTAVAAIGSVLLTLGLTARPVRELPVVTEGLAGVGGLEIPVDDEEHTRS
jgi:EmrB/QacA subfamily drug resistance transporter